MIPLIGTYLFLACIFDFVARVGERSRGTLLRHTRPRGALALSVPAV